jgi:hypothetical protein
LYERAHIIRYFPLNARALQPLALPAATVELLAGRRAVRHA